MLTVTKYVPPSFNRATVRAGLLKAMGFGEPTRAADKVTFYSPSRATVVQPTDGDGIPFDPAVRPAVSGTTGVAVSCAAEFTDASGQPIETGSEIKPSKLKLTLLDEEYQQIKDFSYVTAGGDRYARASVEPAIALGSIDVWIIHCVSEDER